jgi:C1A family cysteine protease
VAHIRSMVIGTLVLSSLVATGCGRTGSLPTANVLASTATQTLSVAGVPRKLGYNFKRYEAVFAPHAHKTHLTRQGLLPAAVDNRQFDAPIYDQGQLGSCTAFSMGKGLREFMQRKNGEQKVPLSALAFYYNERLDQNTVSEDSGATISEGMNTLLNVGAAPDADMPYDITKFKQKPSAKTLAEQAAWKVKSITQLAGVDDAKAAIASGHSVSIGFIVYESIRQATKPGSGGVIPVPKSGEKVLGGHAVELVGYDDAKQLFTVRNSWGTATGVNGYFFMPYAFVSGSTDGQQNVDEIFTAD